MVVDGTVEKAKRGAGERDHTGIDWDRCVEPFENKSLGGQG
jgi:hypothetical protein